MQYILVLEPDEEVGKILSNYLSSDRRTVILTNSAQSAISAADHQKPDVVVIELAIPKQNGFAFLHEFRSYDDWEKIPVIVHSHLAREEAAMSRSWNALGAADYLYKPSATLKDLQTAIDRVLGS